MASLSITYDNGQVLSEPISVINIDSARQDHSIMVSVDGSTSINHFSVSCSEDWITINRLRNNISLSVTENNSLQDRYGRVVLSHNMDANTRIVLMIVQYRPVYGISVSKNGDEVDCVEFSPLLGPNDAYSETEVLDIECTGGLMDYSVRSVLEFGRHSDTDGYRLLPYDNGLQITKIGSTILEITNYGKISRQEDMYYEIVLSHRNDFNTTRSVKVRYITYDNDGFTLVD